MHKQIALKEKKPLPEFPDGRSMIQNGSQTERNRGINLFHPSSNVRTVRRTFSCQSLILDGVGLEGTYSRGAKLTAYKSANPMSFHYVLREERLKQGRVKGLPQQQQQIQSTSTMESVIAEKKRKEKQRNKD